MGNNNDFDWFAFGFGIFCVIALMLFGIFTSYTLFRDRGVRQKTKEPFQIEIIGNDTTFIYYNK